MPKNLLIFGAGASFGSDTSGTPPLGDALFDELQRFNPSGWGRLPQALATAFRQDFEAEMVQVAQTHPHVVPVLQRAMAAFFFQYRPANSNLYVKLARRLSNSHWDGALATINYERLLELSLIQAEIQPVVGAEPSGPQQLELCLPHGCCHLFCDSVRGQAANLSFSGLGRMSVSTSGVVKPIADSQEFQARISNDAFPPVMSYFEPNKRTSSGANFIASQRYRLQILIGDASTIGIVGIRVRPSDKHIWDALVGTSAKLVYRAGESGGREFEHWKKGCRPDAPDEILRGYFLESFEDICHHLEVP